eukprot:gb/GFBE01027617.1/.p2 GENE.gb/GFBE01027617.1/~~gb/GFBE01027617.1/.p2  ORF type:complete len:315 (-),score=90.90 gb/GFBE01027617.1/:129-1073(-)
MALKLQYRSTFIDVEEERCTEGLKVRARSLPASSRLPATEIHEEESQLSNYVTTLAQRAEQLCVLLRRDGNLAQLKEEPVPEAAKQQKLTHQRTRSGSSSTATPHHSDLASSLSSKASDSQGSQILQQPRLRSSATELSGLLEEVMPTPGSVGHPEVCRRPCLYFAAGSCSNGAACGYCHMPHTQRPAHLDKQQRELLKQMSTADLLNIVARQMRSRASHVGFLTEAAEVLSLMDTWAAAAVQVPAGRRAAPRPQQLAKLEYHMNKMTFSTLLSLAVRGQKTGSNENFGDAVTSALGRMREQLAVSEMALRAPQ